MLNLVKAEQLVLKSILQSPELVNEVEDSNYFLSNTAKDIFITFKELYKKNMAFTNDHIILYGNKLNKSIVPETIEKLRTTNIEDDKFKSYYK